MILNLNKGWICLSVEIRIGEALNTLKILPINPIKIHSFYTMHSFLLLTLVNQKRILNYSEASQLGKIL
jgi:hypothetical protein